MLTNKNLKDVFSVVKKNYIFKYAGMYCGGFMAKKIKDSNLSQIELEKLNNALKEHEIFVGISEISEIKRENEDLKILLRSQSELNEDIMIQIKRLERFIENKYEDWCKLGKLDEKDKIIENVNLILKM